MQKQLIYNILCIILYLQNSIVPSELTKQSLPYPIDDERNYYILNLLKSDRYYLNDTLFEKTVWRRKVSHIVLEEVNGFSRVTILLMERYPYNYKAKNFPIFFEYSNYKEALDKLHSLDSFLSRSGVMRVSLHGAKIIKEKIVFPGFPED